MHNIDNLRRYGSFNFIDAPQSESMPSRDRNAAMSLAETSSRRDKLWNVMNTLILGQKNVSVDKILFYFDIKP